MLRYIIVVAAIFFYARADAQKIYFSDTSNKWRVIMSSCGGDDHLPWIDGDRFIGDTVVNGYTYQMLIPDGYLPNGNPILIREDTVNNRVYAIAPDYPTYDTAEELLYDYNLQIGDTFRNKFSTHVVISMDTVSIGNLVYKIWHFNSLAQLPFVEFDVIEGIGCTNTPTYPLYPYFFEECVFESCFQNNGINPPFGHALGTFGWEYWHLGFQGTVHYDNSTSCNETFRLDVTNTPGVYSKALIVPNPITSNSKIMLGSTILNGELVIRNQLGKVVERRIFINTSELPIGRFASNPGLYFYSVLDKHNGRQFVGIFEMAQ